MLNALFVRLDELSHFHFTPRAVAPELAVTVKPPKNVASLALEEKTPLGIAGGDVLAPHEVRPPQATACDPPSPLSAVRVSAGWRSAGTRLQSDRRRSRSGARAEGGRRKEHRRDGPRRAGAAATHQKSASPQGPAGRERRFAPGLAPESRDGQPARARACARGPPEGARRRRGESALEGRREGFLDVRALLPQAARRSFRRGEAGRRGSPAELGRRLARAEAQKGARRQGGRAHAIMLKRKRVVDGQGHLRALVSAGRNCHRKDSAARGRKLGEKVKLKLLHPNNGLLAEAPTTRDLAARHA